MTFSYGDYNDELDHTLKAEEENTNSLFLFANNNTGTAENLGNYRLYDMKIEGDSEGVESGVDYVDCLIGDTASYINTGITVSTGYKIDVIFMTTVEYHKRNGGFHYDCIYGASNPLYYSYDNSNGTSVGLINYNIGVRDNDSGGDGYASYPIKNNCLNKKYTLSRTLVNVSNRFPIYIFANNNSVDNIEFVESICDNTVRIYDFKIYDTEENLLIHLRPCLDTSKVPCMYDEVTKRYFYNRGTGTFGYKKKLRDFQPVLDKNNVPCLMDKINKKYYYAKNGNAFNCREQIGYRAVSYLQGDGNSYINTNIIPNSNTKVVVDAYSTLEDCFNGKCLFGANINFLSYSFQTSTRWLYVGKLGNKQSVGDNSLSESTFVGKHTIIIDLLDTTNVINIDGTNYGTNSGTSTACSVPILLWNTYSYQNSIFSEENLSTAKIFSFKIYQSDELVFDGVPALDTNNVPCLYDKISKQLFYNQGAGTFSYGIEELECPPVNYVEYAKRIGAMQYAIKTKNPNGLITEDTLIKCKIYIGNLDKNNTIYQTVGSYNMYNTSLSFYTDNNKYFRIRLLGSKYDIHLNDYESLLNANEFMFEISSTEIRINDEIITPEWDVSFTQGTFTQPITLFQSIGYQGNYIGSSVIGTKIYYLTFETNGEVVIDFRPALDENNILTMYESVDNIYYYFDNVDTFSYEGELRTPITYIESNGTQYIDTGVVPTDNTDINMVCRSTNVTPYIKDGLILNLDGINNTTNGHDSSTTVWEDLSGNGLNFNLNNITINDDSMSFNGTTSYANIQDIKLWKTIANNTTEYDVELCLKFNNSESYQPIISSNYGLINVAKFVKYLQFKSTNFGLNLSSILGNDNWSKYDKFTISCNMNALLGYFNTTNYTLESTNDSISPPTSDNFSIGTRLTGESYWFHGDIYSIRIYNRHLTDEERLYNHSVDVKRFNVTTDVMTINTDNYIMNELATDNTYKYNATDTTVEPNLTASTGATLTLGATNLAYLTEEEIEQATNDGWTLE